VTFVVRNGWCRHLAISHISNASVNDKSIDVHRGLYVIAFDLWRTYRYDNLIFGMWRHIARGNFTFESAPKKATGAALFRGNDRTRWYFHSKYFPSVTLNNSRSNGCRERLIHHWCMRAAKSRALTCGHNSFLGQHGVGKRSGSLTQRHMVLQSY
jgi:hypothetical protein